MYIRTKDGRIVDTTKISTGSKYMDFATNDESFREIFKTESLSKSENLEELCDEVVFYAKGFIKPQVYDKLQKKEIAVMKQMVNSTIEDVKLYYAIWTDKGLIYVAKIDENGELVLI